MRKSLKKALFLTIVFFIFKCSAYGIDLTRNFEQRINNSFLQDLLDNPNEYRATFYKNQFYSELIILYLSYSPKGKCFILRGNIPAAIEQDLNSAIFSGKLDDFIGFKKNNKPLYKKGKAYIGQAKLKGKKRFKFVFAPHKINKIPNNSFISDLGYLEARIPSDTINNATELKNVLKCIFQKKTQLVKQVQYNSYYCFRDNYFGRVHKLDADSLSQARATSFLLPSHKLTFNKRIKDWAKKKQKDIQICLKIMFEDRYLLSQDERVKRKWVPGFVKLNQKRIANTDIGSGQNHLVFLSIGPGINYFDDPWKTPRKNIPCPRIIFTPEILSFNDYQIYPSYSIDSKKTGDNRCFEINKFQNITPWKTRKTNWISKSAKKPLISSIEAKLLKYGLTNDSADLEPGFKLAAKQFNGNIVNNEIRFNQTVSIKDLTYRIIIPPGSKQDYLQYAASYINNHSTLHKDYICGQKLTDLFIEAPSSDDKGFRIAYLMILLQQTHPQLYRLFRISMPNKGGLNFLLKKVNKEIKAQGIKFFHTPYFKAYSQLKQQQTEAWCNYLEAFRNKKTKEAQQLFKLFKDL